MKLADKGSVTLDRDGQHFEAGWTIDKGLITVSSLKLGSKTTQIGGSRERPDGLARMMLGELVTDYLSKKR